LLFIRGEAPVEFATVARVVDVMRQLDLSVGVDTEAGTIPLIVVKLPLLGGSEFSQGWMLR